MSLINCPKCGKQISNKAGHCPNCGHPINPEMNAPDEKERKQTSLPRLSPSIIQKIFSSKIGHLLLVIGRICAVCLLIIFIVVVIIILPIYMITSM